MAKANETVVVINRDGSKQRIYARDFDAKKHKRADEKAKAAPAKPAS